MRGRDRHSDGVRALALGFATSLVAHAPALRNGFLLDDGELLVNNPYLRSLRGLGTLLTSGLFHASAEPKYTPFYRPVAGFTYWLSVRLVGYGAPLQHAFNLALHACVIALVALSLRAHGASRRAAFGAAVLFGAHPATGDIVAYVGGRQEMVGWLAALAGSMLLPRATTAGASLLVTFGATLVATLSREFFAVAAIALPVTAAFLPHGRFCERRALGSIGGAALAGAVVLGLRQAFAIEPVTLSDGSASSAVGYIVGTALRLAKDVVAPIDLGPEVFIRPVALGPALSAMALAGAAALAADRLVRTGAPQLRGINAQGLAWLAGAAVTHSAIANESGFISDRYAYPVLVGLTLVLVAVGTAVARRASVETLRRPLDVALGYAPVALAVAVLPLTWARDKCWKDEPTLQHQAYVDRPDDPVAILGEAMWRVGQGDIDGAYPHCVAYRAALPESDRADFCLGAFHLVHGDPRGAIPYFRAYADTRPGTESARRGLLASLFAVGELDALRAKLDEWEPMFPNAPDLAEARRELARRSGPPRPPIAP